MLRPDGLRRLARDRSASGPDPGAVLRAALSSPRASPPRVLGMTRSRRGTGARRCLFRAAAGRQSPRDELHLEAAGAALQAHHRSAARAQREPEASGLGRNPLGHQLHLAPSNADLTQQIDELQRAVARVTTMQEAAPRSRLAGPASRVLGHHLL